MVGGGDVTVLSVFSGAGGLDLGLEAAGWKVVAQLELNDDCVGTLRACATRSPHPAEVIHSPIEAVEPEELRRRLGLKKGDLGLLAGGPPCQPFTTTGLRQAIQDRRASSAFPTYLRYVAAFLPHTLLMENVDGMLSAALQHRPLNERGKAHRPLQWEERKASFLHWLLTQLTSLGYSVTWGVLEAADHGVPQLRQRAVLLGVRGDEPCYLPRPTHGRDGLPPYRTLRDALSGVIERGAVQPLSKRKFDVFRLVPPGGNWRDLPEALQQETMGAAYEAAGGKSGWWRRLAWNEPAPTILGMPDHSSTGLIHPDEVRCLSVNECAAIQTFPDDHTFAGSSRSQYQQIGNAVPPRLGEQIGLKLAAYLHGEREVPPGPPPWRQASANRRIGTHGWALRGSGSLRYHVVIKVREDHVWALERDGQLQFV